MAVLFVLGLAMIVIAAFALLGALMQVIRCSRRVTGKVVRVDTKPEIGANGHGFRDCYFPVYEYEVDGKVYQQSGAEYSSREDYFKLGEQKQIKYNPNDPSECIIGRKLGKVVIGIILLAAGTVLIVLA